MAKIQNIINAAECAATDLLKVTLFRTQGILLDQHVRRAAAADMLSLRKLHGLTKEEFAKCCKVLQETEVDYPADVALQITRRVAVQHPVAERFEIIYPLEAREDITPFKPTKPTFAALPGSAEEKRMAFVQLVISDFLSENMSSVDGKVLGFCLLCVRVFRLWYF